MLNPDGVIVGNYRCSLAGRDLNRNYRTNYKEAYPGIWSCREMVKRSVCSLKLKQCMQQAYPGSEFFLHSVLCYSELCYSVLCYSVLCYSVLCYSVLCCSVLCYSVLCYSVLIPFLRVLL